MRGTIIKRGNRYSVVIDLGRDPTTGKRKREWHSGYATEKEAEDARVEILASLQRGVYVSPSKRTVAGFLVDDWLPAIKASVRPSTFDSYARNVELHVVRHIGPTSLQKLSPGHQSQ